jgi:hypothetical protein
MGRRTLLFIGALFSSPFLFAVSGPSIAFRRGDVNSDGVVDISDPITVLSSLFQDPDRRIPCLEAADANGDRELDISDGLYLLSFLFLGTAPPPPPFEECGVDPGDSGLGCEEFSGCIPVLDPGWIVRREGPTVGSDFPVGLALDGEGNIVVSFTEPFGGGTAFGVTKYAPDGGERWHSSYQQYPGAMAVPWAMALDGAGNIIVTGQRASGPLTPNTRFESTTVKFDPSGNLVWEVPLEFDQARAFGLGLDGQGNTWIAAAELRSRVQPDAFLTVKYDPEGKELWAAPFALSTLLQTAQAWGMISVDRSGRASVVVNEIFYDCGSRSTILRYGPEGGLRWSIAREPLCSSFQISDLMADGSGSTLATGAETTPGDGHALRTFKYDAEGHESWSGNSSGRPSEGVLLKLRADASGNSYVTGVDYVEGRRDSDFIVAKHDPDGKVLWTSRYDGLARGDDSGEDLALDQKGNVVAAGYSESAAGGRDFLTLIYDAEGHLARSARYNGPENRSDEAHAILIDPTGSIYVAGTSSGLDRRVDLVLIKYLSPR